MNIPTNPKNAPLEMKSIKLYSTGLKKVFTNHFYKSMNHNFGIEIVITNNTSSIQKLKIGGCVNNSKGKKVVNWISTKSIKPYSSESYDFYVREKEFNKMDSGKYTVIFWINDKRVKETTFTITYK